MRSQTCWVVGCSSSVERAIRHHLAAIGAGCSPGDQLPGRRPFLRRSAAKPEGGDGPHNKVIAASNARCAERMHPYPAIAPAWVDFVQRAAMAQLIEAEAGDAPMIGEKTRIMCWNCRALRHCIRPRGSWSCSAMGVTARSPLGSSTCICIPKRPWRDTRAWLISWKSLRRPGRATWISDYDLPGLFPIAA
jgi:hypothetical protein